MSDPLATYLSDHYAASMGAVELLQFLRDHHEGEPTGRFAAEILSEVEKDREVLDDLLDRCGAKTVARLKAGPAWIAEKFSRLKLHRRAGEGLGTLLALETLALGIHGKRVLWQTLDDIAASDSRLNGIDFPRLAERASSQYDKVESHRLDLARDLLASP